MSCFFTKEFMKIPGIDVNYVDREKETFLKAAVFEKNPKAVEYLLNNFPQIDVNSFAFGKIFASLFRLRNLVRYEDSEISL